MKEKLAGPGCNDRETHGNTMFSWKMSIKPTQFWSIWGVDNSDPRMKNIEIQCYYAPPQNLILGLHPGIASLRFLDRNNMFFLGVSDLQQPSKVARIICCQVCANSLLYTTFVEYWVWEENVLWQWHAFFWAANRCKDEQHVCCVYSVYRIYIYSYMHKCYCNLLYTVC